MLIDVCANDVCALTPIGKILFVAGLPEQCPRLSYIHKFRTSQATNPSMNLTRGFSVSAPPKDRTLKFLAECDFIHSRMEQVAP